MSTKFNPLVKKGFDKIGDTSGLISDTAFGSSWDGVTDVAPSKNAVYDAISGLAGGHAPVTLDVNADTLLSLSTQELGLDTQAANRVFAGPTSGVAAVPTFRALVADDIPDLSGIYLTAETDPDFNAWLSATPPLYPGGWYDAAQNTIGLSGFNNDAGFITGVNWNEIGGDQSDINVGDFTNDVGYITSFDDEKVKYDALDPTAGYIADKIIAGDGISVAEGTGGNENKLVITSEITQYTDSDAVSAIKADASWKATNWDTAYGWGDHSAAGYLKRDGTVAITANWNVDGANTLYIDITNNRVGVGKIPSTPLDVNGIIAVAGTRTVYNPAAQGTFIGSLFYGTGGASLSHTTGNEGYYNTGVGVRALNFVSTGYQNTAVGHSSLDNLTSGYYNTAMGYYALRNSISIVGGTVIGAFALHYLESGNNNVAVGYSAGRYVSGGSNNTQVENCVFVGYNTRPNALGDTNEIVIGAGAMGLGSNTVVLGNTSITTTALRGQVGVAITTPTAQLDVNGATGYNQLRLRTSYTPTGTSDTNGNTGDLAWDSNYIYIKTSDGWKRAALSTF